MSTPASAVPDRFRIVHLDLAREPDHPEGSANDRYTLLVPLDPEGRILASEARAHPDLCRVSHTADRGEIKRGLMRPGPHGAWIFDFGEKSGEPEVGFRFAEERFVPGEYVSVVRGDEEHTYRVISLLSL